MKRPRSLFKARRRGSPAEGPRTPRPQWTPRQEFQWAMVATEMEAILDHGRPCLRCGDQTHSPGCWFPTPPIAAYLGAPPGKIRVVIYALCEDCHHHDPGGSVVAERILAERRTALAAADAGLALVAGAVQFGSPEDVARFGAAWQRHEPPAPEASR
jgi:hypothetical protein